MCSVMIRFEQVTIVVHRSPAKAGVQSDLKQRSLSLIWTPAFAGEQQERGQWQ